MKLPFVLLQHLVEVIKNHLAITFKKLAKTPSGIAAEAHLQQLRE